MNVLLMQVPQYPSKTQSIIFCPNQRLFPGFKRDDLGTEFWLRLQCVVDRRKWKQRLDYPIMGASNIGSATPWVKIRPRDGGPKKATKALIDILDDFPSYESQSEARSDMAIRNIESRLNAVASFEARN